jgi:hypothetical protein
MIEIKLTRGMVAIVSDIDRDLAKHKWAARHCGKSYYAHRRANCKMIDLHRVVLERKVSRPLRQGEWADHANCNSLDNCRSNLRIATPSQNLHNKPKRSVSCTSRYKGVYYDKVRKKWTPEIKCKGKKYYLGRYDSEAEAALAYNKKAIELLGQFAYLNEIET